MITQDEYLKILTQANRIAIQMGLQEGTKRKFYKDEFEGLSVWVAIHVFWLLGLRGIQAVVYLDESGNPTIRVVRWYTAAEGMNSEWDHG